MSIKWRRARGLVENVVRREGGGGGGGEGGGDGKRAGNSIMWAM